MSGRGAGRINEIAVPGDWNAICDLCGRRFKASELRKNWKNLMVCPDDWEPRHVSDFFRLPDEKIDVPFARTDCDGVFRQVTFEDTTEGDPDNDGTFDDHIHDYIEAGRVIPWIWHSHITCFAADFTPNTNILRGEDLTGNADGQKGTLAVWVNPDESGGFYVFGSSSNFFRLSREGNGTMIIRANAAGGNGAGEILSLHSSVVVTENTGWHVLLASWDLSAGKGHFYVDDVEAFTSSPTLTDDTIDYTRTEWAVGSDGGSNNGTFWAGCIGCLWFSTTLYLDLSVQANRDLFYTSALDHVHLGSTGIVESTTPIIYLNQAVPDYGSNLGSGGDFSAGTGTLSSCPGL